jgi:dTDP-D-glucose 4,6-dehydratase
MTNKNVLITGGAGFIGAHLVEHLLINTDWNLTIIDRLTYSGNLNRLAQMGCWEAEKHRIRFVYHDIRSAFVGKIREQVENNSGIDYIIHAAAETHVDNSIKDPAPFATSNVIGTMNMLDLARYLLPEKFIYVSTDEVYGPVEGGELHVEGEPHNPSNPYAASKSGAEAFCRAYYKSYGVPVIITNTMNNFGERQDIEKFIPKVIRAVDRGESIPIHCKLGEPSKTSVSTKQVVDALGFRPILDISSRCWLHARNHADALMFLLEEGQIGDRYNVVGEWATVLNITDMISKFMNKPGKIKYVDFHSTRPGHDMHYGLDGSKLKYLGWVPPFNLMESLQRTVEWALAHKEWM